ncbi:MAG: T9SS type A sorting domain-containing protein [Winogradskyella sp.]|uniref:T9SS type A sorting domain-containing protein n=1 Tax=Winogradskyella sp. TaxID=1883156 RepID=UPI0017ED1185|nr:T9SS type A sorting domain-containing protein [Winogradskyella sp.]
MRLAVFALLFFCFSTSFAQLSVRNDAFVYVKDQIIYVKDDVNLTEADSKLYLREDSQLIQGDGTTGNSGLGELSVYQEGNTNVWSYNYWCSPTGGVLSNTTVNNDFRINQLDDPLLATASTIDSKNSAFTNALEGNTTDSLTISRRWLYTYESSDSFSDWNYVGDDQDVSTGLGFTMKGFGTGPTGNQSYDFRGKPNNGTIGNTVVDGLFTLVGNPYPSAMDSALYIHDTDNAAAITGTLYFWEQDGTVNSHALQDYVGGYYEFTINAAGDVITDTPAAFKTYNESDNSFALTVPQNGVKSADRYIPIGQGFMVKGATGTPGTVYAKNSFRVYEKPGSESVFFRAANTTGERAPNDNTDVAVQSNGLSIVPDDYMRFRINVDFNVNSAHYTRQLVLNFHADATAGFDKGLELIRAENFPSDANFVLEGETYSAQAFQFDEALVIPLNIDIEVTQPLRFRIFDIQNFDDTQGIYLHDLENESYINLRDQDYELNIIPGNYPNRFEVVFTPSNLLSIDDVDANSLTVSQINRIQELTVLNPKGLDITAIEVFDINGRRVFNQSYNTIKNSYKLSTSSISNGIYIVNVVADSNTIKSQKIIVKN